MLTVAQVLFLRMKPAHSHTHLPVHWLQKTWLNTQAVIAAGLLLLLTTGGLYWYALLSGQQAQRAHVQAQTQLRVAQMSHALSVQAGTMLSGLDYVLRNLVEEFTTADDDGFQRMVDTVLVSYPSGAILQIAVADKNGDLLYSSLEQREPNRDPNQAKKSIADREHFRVHLLHQAKGMYISKPVKGRISQRWSVQLTRAITTHEGAFAGVVVLSLSSDYIAHFFRGIFDSPGDVIMLLRSDGAYLARSLRQEEVLGTSVPSTRQFVQEPLTHAGTYEVAAPIDGIERFYAWTRVQGFPVLVSAGLEKQAIFGPLNATLHSNFVSNVIGTTGIFLGAFLLSWLVWQRQRNLQSIGQSEARLRLLAEQVPGGLFQLRLHPDQSKELVYASPGLYAIHCVDAPASNPALLGSASILVHVPLVDMRAMARSMRTSASTLQAWHCKYRLQCPDGHKRWLHGHAQPQVEANGAIVWHGYVRDVTEEQHLQDALQRSEERLRLTVCAVGDGLWQWHLLENQIEWDTRCWSMLGYPEQAQSMHVDDFTEAVHPLDRARMLSHTLAHIQHGETFRTEFRVRTASGGWCWIESRGQVTARDSAGQPVRMLGTHTDIQKRKEQSQLVAALLDHASALIVVATPERTFLHANARAQESFASAGQAQLVGQSLRRIHQDDASFEAFSAWYTPLRQYGKARCEWAIRKADGSVRWHDIQGTLLDPEDPHGNVIWTMVDTDDRHQAEQALRQAEQRLQAIIKQFPAGVLLTDACEHTVLATNEALCLLLNLPWTPETLLGQSLFALEQSLSPELAQALHTTPALAAQSMAQNAAPRTVGSVESGLVLQVEHIALQHQAQDLGHFWVLRDVTARKLREMRLELLASTDSLTHLSNRRAFMARLELELEEVRAGTQTPGTLVMIDIDFFKKVNDTYGHAAGDQVIQHLAETLAHGLRRNDLAGRLGGEEFAMLLSGAGSDGGLMHAERLRQAVASSSAKVQGIGHIPYTVSVGVYPLQRDTLPPEECLARADAAMYQSKHQGRNRTTLWHDGMVV